MVDHVAQDERRVAYWDDESHHPDHQDFFIVSGEGCWITDKSGRRLLDAASGHSCVNLGYANEELIEVAAQSYRRLAYCSPEHRCQSVAALSARLSDRLGGDYRLRYATTGGGANELAIEIARRHWLHVGDPGRETSSLWIAVITGQPARRASQAAPVFCSRLTRTATRNFDMWSVRAIQSTGDRET